jgi:dynein light intermediate chain 1
MTQSPNTLANLRQYALHLLFMPPAPPPGGGAGTTEGTASVRNPFPFTVKANTLDRDHVVVPAGWDSWGKIGVLRDGFDAKAWGAAWERDLAAATGEDLEEAGALEMFAELVSDESVKVRAPAYYCPITDRLQPPAASRATSVQRTDVRTSVPHQALRRERKEV